MSDSDKSGQRDYHGLRTTGIGSIALGVFTVLVYVCTARHEFIFYMVAEIYLGFGFFAVTFDYCASNTSHSKLTQWTCSILACATGMAISIGTYYLL